VITSLPQDSRSTQRETGIFASGIILQVTGDGHQGIGRSGVGRSAFGTRFPRLIAKKPKPELPMPVAVTLHPENFGYVVMQSRPTRRIPCQLVN